MKKYYDQLVQIMPDPGSLAFFVFLVLSVTAVHIFIGSGDDPWNLPSLVAIHRIVMKLTISL
jgi:hypothetical protein